MPVIGFKKPTDKHARRYSSDRKVRARELVEDGKLGGARPGAGRPRKSASEGQKVKRASAVVAEAARAHADQIASVISDVVSDPAASRHVRLRAAKLAVDIEHKEDTHAREEDERMGRSRVELPEDRDALAEALAAKLASNPILAAELGAVLARAGQLAGLPPKSS